jgi:nucleoside-specific outer membrane channel protein Tsx
MTKVSSTNLFQYLGLKSEEFRAMFSKFREAIEIEKQPNNRNRDDGWKISQNWIPTLANMNKSKY